MTPAQQFFNGWMPHCGLAPREREVLKLVMRGYGSRDISSKLGISRNTVLVYLAHIRQSAESQSMREVLFEAWIKFAEDFTREVRQSQSEYCKSFSAMRT